MVGICRVRYAQPDHKEAMPRTGDVKMSGEYAVYSEGGRECVALGWSSRARMDGQHCLLGLVLPFSQFLTVFRFMRSFSARAIWVRLNLLRKSLSDFEGARQLLEQG